jgi:hypothetical protein
MTRIDPDRFAGYDFSDCPLVDLKSAAAMVEQEMLRQINVRDHALAEQAELVVAFRPFSRPDSPEPAGGVEEEVEVLIRKTTLGTPRCHPGIVVIHPAEDEQRRRANEFADAWASVVASFPEQDQKAIDTFRAQCLSVFLEAVPGAGDIAGKITEAVAKSHVRVNPDRDTSSMPAHPILREQNAAAALAKDLAEQRPILSSRLHDEAVKRTKDVIILRDDLDASIELARLIRQIVEEGARP